MIFKISLIKTLFFNIKCFGAKFYIFPILIGKKVKLESKGKIIIPNLKFGAVKIGLDSLKSFNRNYDYTLFANFGTIKFKGNANFLTGTRILNFNNLTFGKNIIINGGGTTIRCRKKITFGEDVLISWNSTIMDSDEHKIYNSEKTEQLNPNKSITIGNRVWICADSKILKGSFIKDDSVVASNAVVSKEISKSNVIIGDINKILRENIIWNG